ncbi:MAG: YeeE/YedE family protein [Alphaproteobacteria bacterium]|nr:YeeE/YedE family protein [Alphaproteobacteria bacterium]
MVIALLGGVLIGVACGVLTLLTGRVMSASSMVGSLVGGAEGVAATSIAFIGGIVAAPLMMTGLGVAQQKVVEPGWPLLVIGGLLVGVSARWGGASLGAVVTGIARRTPRSLVMLLVMLGGATIGGILQVLFGGQMLLGGGDAA